MGCRLYRAIDLVGAIMTTSVPKVEPLFRTLERIAFQLEVAKVRKNPDLIRMSCRELSRVYEERVKPSVNLNRFPQERANAIKAKLDSVQEYYR